MKEIDLHACPSLATQARLQVDRSGKEVLLFPEGILELNETARDIVARCDGKTSVESLIAALAQEYDVAIAEMQSDVLEYLRELHQRRLLVVC